MLEHVAGAIGPGTLPVPHAEHAIVTRAVEQIDLLAAPYRGRAEVFVQSRLKADAMRGEMPGRLPKIQIERPER